MIKLIFISSKKPFSFLRYLKLWTNFFVDVVKRLYKIAKANFKIYNSNTGADSLGGGGGLVPPLKLNI